VKIGGWAPHDLHDHGAEEVARDEAEGARLAYVAATRARDLLVVPALGDEPWEGGWLGPLNQALYPPLAARRSASRGARCPPFKSKDSVLERPNGEPAGPTTVCPGCHDFDEGYGVVWWDPGALALDLVPPFGVRREDLIVKDVPRDVVADGRSRYDHWRAARAAAKLAGATPSCTVATVRAHAATDAEVDTKSVAIVDLASGEQTGDLAGGVAFGSLVHAVLAGVPFDASAEALEEVARLEARVLAMSPAEASAAAGAVARLLRHDLLQRARVAEARGRCRRETPITRKLADGTLVEGVVDLAFEDESGWIVVDYKTDRELRGAGVEQYRRQVALYAEAIAEATGTAARPILVRL
jgi:ATP-dependent exoDNAse (exonuclease V) beta subunit